MPKNLPTTTQAWEEVTFFSIDTSLIQAAGYNFSKGALHQLPNQLPEFIGLQLPEIVLCEIVKHRMASVREAHVSLHSATNDLQRPALLDVSEVQRNLEELNVIEVAT